MEQNDIWRDDHCVTQDDKGAWYSFGGYVNGSRVNDVLCLEKTLNNVDCKKLTKGESECPSMRAGASIAAHSEELVIFGG